MNRERRGDAGVEIASSNGALQASPRRAPAVNIDPVVAVTMTLLVIAPIWIAVKMSGPLTGPDTFWHLALGRHLRQTWDFGTADPLSPFSAEPWVYNQWIPQVAASFAEDVGGLPAVAFLAMAARLAIFAALWVICRRRASALPALAAALVGAVGGAHGWDARPQLLGILLFVVTVAAAVATIDDGRPRWWLVPLAWVWACSHGTWVLGVALLLVVSVSAFIDRPTDPLKAHGARLAVPVGMAAMAAMTPVGPRLYTSLTAVNQVSEFIQEWQPMSLRDPYMAATMVGIGFVILSWARGWVPRPSWGRIALLAFAAANALMYGRTLAMAAALVAPLLAEALQQVVPNRGLGRREVWALSTGVAAALVYAAMTLPTTAKEPGDAPVGLSRALSSLPAQTVFNEQGVAGWLYWRHPQLQPVFDTRAEVFGRQGVINHLHVSSVASGWEAMFDKTGARVALLRGDSPLSGALRTQRGWEEKASDAGFVILVAPS